MKILLGAHGTGKSTLLEAINIIKPEYYTSDGFSRPIKKIKNQIGLNDIAEQVAINELTNWAFDNYVKKTNVISARSPIDTIIYSNLLFPEIITNDIENNFVSKISHIEQVFYLPIEFDIVNDGMRFVDKTFQGDVDFALLSFCTKHNIPLIKLSGTVPERIKQIEKYL
jgi:predicted ATPase